MCNLRMLSTFFVEKNLPESFPKVQINDDKLYKMGKRTRPETWIQLEFSNNEK